MAYSDLSSFEKFCGNSPFWNFTLLRHSSYPEFTECFKQVALQWIPCALFLVASIPYLVHVLLKKDTPMNAGFLAVAKTICSMLLVAVAIATLMVRGEDIDQDSIPDALYLSEGLKVASFVVTTVFIQLERRKGFVRSPFLWFFWLILLVCAIVPFYSNIEEDVQDDDTFGFVIVYVYFGLVMLSFILSSFAEIPYKLDRNFEIQGGMPSPELEASMPSILTLSWLIGLIYRGYKKSLENDDVFDINPKDLSKNNLPMFERSWENEAAKVQEYNSKIRSSQGMSLSQTLLKRKLDENSPLFPPNAKSKVKSPYKQVGLLKVLWKTYGPFFIGSVFLRTACDMLQFVTPKLTEAILDYISFRSEYHEWQGYCLAASFAVILTISVIGSNYATLISRRIGMNAKGVLMNAIYKKSLTINSIDEEMTTGQVTNLMSIDCQKVEDLSMYVYLLMSAPFQLALSMYMLYDKMKVSAFAGVGVMLLMFPINLVVGRVLGRFQIAQMKLKDKRMKLTTEVLNGIKVLKLYAWEESFEDKVTAVRQEEMDYSKSGRQAVAFLIYMVNSLPFMVQITSFAVYIAVSDEGYLSPVVAAVSMQLFALLNTPLAVLPILIPQLVQTMISVRRISKYLNQPDVDPDVVHLDKTAANAIEIKDGEFTWDHKQLPTLRDINITIKPGSLVAVVGMVGSGKSSLLSAILGEMLKLKGDVTIKDSLAYVSQEAWIQNATVKDNILFGTPIDRRKYDKIIEACALKSDLDILPAGDKTEIGEKGINISGGQKQRVSLARAVYSDNEIYLLDDPLSAVDSHVGKHIFKHVISSTGLLKDKTRVLVTHGIHWLPMVDNIIVMVDGKISEIGTCDELLSKDGPLAQFLKEHIQDIVESDIEEETDPEVVAMTRSVLKRLNSVTGSVKELSTSGEEWTSQSFEKSPKISKRTKSQQSLGKQPSSPVDVDGPSILEETLSGHSEGHRSSIGHLLPPSAAGEKLTEEEKKGDGKIKWSVYGYYLNTLGIDTVIFSILLYAGFAGSKFYTGIWLSDWTSDELLLNTSRSDEDEYGDTTVRFMVVYGVVGLAQGLFVLVVTLLSAVKATKAACILHKRMLTNILRLPMTFFDTTPIGRIINRFSQDFEVIDFTLPVTLRQMLFCVSTILGNIVTISYGTPIFLIAVGPLAIVYIIVAVLFVPVSRQIRRLVSVSRSPIFTHFTETLSGVSTIRAYKCHERFQEESRKRIDYNFKFYFIDLAGQIWVSIWLQLLGNMVVFAAALFAITSTDINAGTAGVSISYATMVTTSLQIFVNNLSQIENHLVSMERIKEYSSEKREANWINPSHRPESDWPYDGAMQFQNYETRYRPGLELVLKGISCHIKGGEKIGVVGRTGAGKSSMTVALFRLIEPAGGQIIIDTEDISSIGLHDLRKNLTILPQDPVLFSGSLRMNLDPFEESSDMAVWDALERCFLKDFIQGLPNGLDYECGEGGSNLSVGQRQLLCLGRTLLRKTKILVLDEATAAVDMETDQLIQKTIKEEFKDSTVLTIAHRLNTIMDYDRVMVLDKGTIKEFDSPSILLGDTTTVFYSMAKSAGLV